MAETHKDMGPWEGTVFSSLEIRPRYLFVRDSGKTGLWLWDVQKVFCWCLPDLDFPTVHWGFLGSNLIDNGSNPLRPQPDSHDVQKDLLGSGSKNEASTRPTRLLVGGWALPTPTWKMMDNSSVGMMTFPIWWESHKIPCFQTTNEIYIYIYYTV